MARGRAPPLPGPARRALGPVSISPPGASVGVPSETQKPQRVALSSGPRRSRAVPRLSVAARRRRPPGGWRRRWPWADLAVGIPGQATPSQRAHLVQPRSVGPWQIKITRISESIAAALPALLGPAAQPGRPPSEPLPRRVSWSRCATVNIRSRRAKKTI